MPTNKKKKGKKKAGAAVARGTSGARGSNVNKGANKAPASGAFATGAAAGRQATSRGSPFTAALASEIDPAILPPPVVSSAEHDPVPAPRGATCWICLEGRDDEDDDEDEGKAANAGGVALEPLRRNCACRGPSSGYAHLSCLSSYASARSEEVWTGKRKVAPNMMQLAFGQPWESCPNCKQYFAGQLRIDVAYEFARSTAGMVGGPRTFRHLVARSWITKSLMGTTFGDTKIDEIMKEFDALLDLIASTRMNGYYDGSNVMSKSNIMNHLVRLHVDQLEAETNFNYGSVLYREATMMGHDSSPNVDSKKGLFKKSIRAHEKAIEIFETLKISGLIDRSQLENSIMHVRASMSQVTKDFEEYNDPEETGADESEMLRLSEQLWKTKIAQRGEDSQDAIQFGLLHVQKLINATNPPKLYEAAELLPELVVKSRRALGPDHVVTKNVLDMYGLMQKRSAKLANQNDDTYLPILRFDEDANQYVLRNDENNSEMTVPPSDLILKRGTLVTCVGLKGAKHLNGRKGWVEGYDEEKARHEVGFHGEDLDSTYLVRPANLQVIFLDDV